MLRITKLKPGQICSELSVYRVDKVGSESTALTILPSNQKISISNEYVASNLVSANNYDDEEIVGKEDKLWTQKQVDDYFAKASETEKEFNKDLRVGDVRVKGIRTLFSEIGEHVFTVVYRKQDTPKSAKAIKAEKETKAQQLVDALEKAKEQHKSMSKVAAKFVEDLLKNPVLDFVPGEMRTLVGYKIGTHIPRDGKYFVMDCEIGEPRLVNINTIQELIYNGVKYIVEK